MNDIQDIILESEYNVLNSLYEYYNKQYIMESYYMEDGEPAKNPNLIKRFIEWCKRAIAWVKTKVQSIFRSNNTSPVKIDKSGLNNLSTDFKVDKEQIVARLNELKAMSDSDAKAVAKAISELTDEINKQLELAKKDNDQASIKLCTDYLKELTKLSQAITAAVGENGSKVILENLKKGFNNQGASSGSIRGTIIASVRPRVHDYVMTSLMAKYCNLYHSNMDPNNAFSFKSQFKNGKYMVVMGGTMDYLYKYLNVQPRTDVLGFTGEKGYETRDNWGRICTFTIGYIFEPDQLSDNIIPKFDIRRLAETVKNIHDTIYLYGIDEKTKAGMETQDDINFLPIMDKFAKVEDIPVTKGA